MACALIVALAWVNIIGVLWGGRVQLVVTILKASFLVIVGIAPWLMELAGEEAIVASNFRSSVEPAHAALGAQIAAVLLAVLWAYDGWHGVTPLAEEIRDPQRNVPRSLFLGVIILIALYVTANIAYHGVLSMQEMKAAGDHAAERMIEKIAGPMGRNAMSFVIMCTTFGAINTVLLYSPRITFAVARDTPALSFLSHVHGTYRSPARSIAANAVMALILIFVVITARFVSRDMDLDQFNSELTRRIFQGLRDDSIFDLLTDLVVFSVSIFYALAVFAVVVLRFRRPDLARPYRTWGYPATPVVFLAVYVWFLWRVYNGNPLESRVGLFLIAVGAPVYWLCHRFGPRATRS